MKLKIIIFLTFLSLPFSVFAAEACPPGETRYRPGGDCEKQTPFIHQNINEYPITCQNTPSVSYRRESRIPPPNPNTAIVSVNTNISLAELGGFGPNLETITTKTPDALAALYPFNALLDKPPNTSPFNERESFRTYWRLLSSLQQANAKAAYLQEVKKEKIKDNIYKFYNRYDQEKKWQVSVLYNKLPGCLKRYPVCEDFIKKYQGLSKDVQEAYDALMPFSFDNLRGYEVIKYNSPTGGVVVNIIAENLPYIAAINQGLLNPQTGILSSLSPSWVNLIRQKNLTSNTTIKEENEQSLVSKIESRVQNIKCQNQSNQGMSLPSFLTYPQGINGSNVELEQTFEIPITTRKETVLINGVPRVVYISEGGGEGTTSVQILNNPKQKDISLGLAEDTSSSLFHSFTPAFAQNPYQDKNLQAPTAKREGDVPASGKGSVNVADSDTFIPRKGGEPHTKLCELRNWWFIPASLQRNVDCQNLSGAISVPQPTITPPQNTINCNRFAPPTSSSAIISAEEINSNNFASGHSQENVTLCYNDLVSQALAAGYDPAFTMAIWLEESGASNYQAFPNVADFGCTVGTPRADFSNQISCFHKLIPSYATADHWKECRGPDNRLSMREFLLIYEGGYDSCRAGEFTKEPQFPQRIQEYYSIISGGRTLDLNQILSP